MGHFLQTPPPATPGFRKCFPKGGPQSSSYLGGSCRAGKAYSRPWSLSRGIPGQLLKCQETCPWLHPENRWVLTWPLVEGGCSAPSRFSPSGHQTSAGADSSPEEMLRQAGCKQQPGAGVELWRGAEQRQERLPEEGVAREVGKLLEREPAK